MADGGEVPDESILDLTKKKKKKKPKDETSGTAASAEKEADENLPTEPKATKEKKSKNVAFAGETTENQENANVKTETATAAAEDDDDGNILANRKKKKAKSRDAASASATTETDVQTTTTTSETTEGTNVTDGTAAQGEYSYDDLLVRVFKVLRAEKGDGEGEGERYKLILKPPQVARIGTKRTSFTNFGEICKSLKRQEKHLHQYLLAELGTNGSIDINSALIIKGRFQQKQIESVLRSYIKEYVICKTCRSADTNLQKEERLTVLFCNNCRSRYFVIGIKTGFQAQVGKRAATRAKAT